MEVTPSTERCPHDDAIKSRGIHYLDVGASGAGGGLERGYFMRIAGAEETAASSLSCVNLRYPWTLTTFFPVPIDLFALFTGKNGPGKL